MPDDCRILKTIADAPILVFTLAQNANNLSAWAKRGCEIVGLESSIDGNLKMADVVSELGRRRMTNVLVEGGGGVLGGFFDERLIDEVHAFIAPKLIGGRRALSPFSGRGIESMGDALRLKDLRVEMIGDDVLAHGFTLQIDNCKLQNAN